MGRSKFPGKPSKHVNRQRVNVLACSANRETHRTVVIAENIFIGLPNANNPTSTTSEENVPQIKSDEVCDEERDSKETVEKGEQETKGENEKQASDRRKTKKIGPKLFRHRLNVSREASTCAIRRSQLRRTEFRSRTRRDSIGGKFILPQRSVHSSRVIKPNKRFVESDLANKKRKLDKLAVPPTKPCSKPPSLEQSKSQISEPTSQSSSTNKIESTQPNRFVLRKAKLQLHHHNITGRHDGPFSSSISSEQTTNIATSPGTITCGVCGAVRFYRFIKQARKFNIYSCESCRKFISKMIKRQACNKNTSFTKLVCHKGQGMCHVPPIVRSQQWNLIRCAYKARCPACWLKMCLRSFKMPAKLKSSLAEMLPINMQPVDSVSDTSVSSLAWKKLVNPNQKSDFSFPNVTSLFKPIDSANLMSSRNKRSTFLRTRKKNVANNSLSSLSQPPDKNMRQKLDLKGPRVKHVCRSASIVLGQPAATFQNKHIVDPQLSHTHSTECNSDSGQDCDDCHLLANKKVHSESSHSNDSEIEESKSHMTLYSSLKTVHRSQQQLCSEPTYDAVEVRQNGFGLVMSRGVVPKQVCFLCGSAGREQLIHCSICCEPYHDYCVGADAAAAFIGAWTCARCSVICLQCLQPATRTTPCLLCRQLFHSSCLEIDTVLCKSCLRCTKCDSTTVHTIVGDAAYCSKCFCHKYKNQRCPHCQGGFKSPSSYEVIYCWTCKNLWHTSCDNITKEELLMLRTLSLCGEYMCHMCILKSDAGTVMESRGQGSNGSKCGDTVVMWRDRIRIHFLVGCLAVLRTLAELHVSHNKQRDTEKNKNRENPTKNINLFNKDCIQSLDRNLLTQYNSDSLTSSKSFKSIFKSSCNDNVTKVSSDPVPEYFKQKFFLRDCSVAINNIRFANDKSKTNASDLCIRATEKIDSALCDNDYDSIVTKKCACTEMLTLLEVKRKVVSKDYISLNEFRHDLELAIRGSGWNEVFGLLDDIFRKEFPWCALSISTSFTTCCPEVETKLMNTCLTCPKPTQKSIETNENGSEGEESVEIYDSRNCVLCLCHGDKLDSEGGRLLYCESNTCIHVACALWSVGIHETLDGALLGVAATVRRARLARCVTCKLKGATIDCSDSNCRASYHFPCARKAGCRFVKNYRVFCENHTSLTQKEQQLSDEDFQIRRSVYVHMDLKKHIFSETHSKWQFVVGSLVVHNLGTYFPEVSDVDDVIIPSGMACTKLFWSTVEPWRIVQYNITTIVASGEHNTYNGLEKNISIDHSDSEKIVNEQLEYIRQLHEQDSDDEEALSPEDDSIGRVSREVINYIIDTICSAEDEELPQNATDILPPEIKDAIFEDLPHDVLDGISMQDIFPKLMSYDDILNMSEICLKNEEISPDLISNKTKKRVENEAIWSNMKSTEDLSSEDICHELISNKIKRRQKLEVTCPIIKAADDSIHSNNFPHRSLKRSKSDVLPHSNLSPDSNSNHQRSCSLTWSCKLNSGTVKKRKISCVTEVESNVLMLVDDSYSNILNQPKEKRSSDVGVLQRRILQVDGAGDLSESSEEDEEIEDSFIAPPVEVADDEPVRCQRCQCTYRTPDSYARHLSGCETMSTSDSEAETFDPTDKTPTDIIISTANTILNVENNVFNPNILHSTPASPLVTIPNKYDSNEIHSQPIIYANKIPHANVGYQNSNFSFAPSMIQQNTNSTLVCDDPRFLVRSQMPDVVFYNNPNLNQPIQNGIYQTKLSGNSFQNIPLENITGNPQNFNIQTFTSNDLSETFVTNSSAKMVQQNICVNENLHFNNIQQSVDNISYNNMQQIVNRANPNENLTHKYVLPINLKPQTKLEVKRKTVSPTKKIKAKPVKIQKNDLSSVNILQQISGLQQPNTIMVQQPLMQPKLFVNDISGFASNDIMKPNNLITSPGIQYILAPNLNIMNNTQLITASNQLITPMTNAFQTIPQTMNFITDLGGSSDMVISPSPIVFQANPQMSSSAAFECGIMSTEQIVFAPQIQNQPTIPCMYVSGIAPSQPVIYGLETVVQNTVMSQQFMSKVSLPGLLAQNSYHTATTQVFQTSTIEPIPEIPTNNCMMIQSPQIISQKIIDTNISNQQICPTILPSTNSSLLPSVPVVRNTESSVMLSSSVAPPQPKPPVNKIPTNIVPPTPKPTRPTNRVLPMTVRSPAPKIPESNPKIRIEKIESIIPFFDNNKSELKPDKPIPLEKYDTNSIVPVNKFILNETRTNKPEPKPSIFDTIKESGIKNNIKIVKTKEIPVNCDNTQPIETDDLKLDVPKENNINLENASLKMVFQKQNQNGLYKISSKPKVIDSRETNEKIKIASLDTLPKSGDHTLNSNLFISIVKETPKTSDFDCVVNKSKKKKHTKYEPPKKPKLLFKVQSQDGFSFTCASLSELWQRVFDAVQESRKLHKMDPLPAEALNGYQAFGLKNQSLKCILDEMKKLRLAEKQREYVDDNELLHGSAKGAARCTPYNGQRAEHDLFSWLASKHRQLEFPVGYDLEMISRRASSINLPIAMRYRNLKETSKQCVGVYRSNIHGRGLFCLRDIELGEMVIEYAGEVIRSSMTDMREKYYNSKGIGCYMFRIDDNLVVDATMKGNAARFINHSCDPNCYSRVLDILGHKHILIFALRKIQQGEELTYDYKFPFEEDKIPCTCGARRCRKYLN